MSTTIFGQDDDIEEGSSALYRCAFVDPAGSAIDGGSITAIAATLSALPSGTIINDRDSQDVRGTNGGALSVEGVFTLTLSTLDTVALPADPARFQVRRLTLSVDFTNGHLNHEVKFFVYTLPDI